jgi:hypothetical protein
VNVLNPKVFVNSVTDELKEGMDMTGSKKSDNSIRTQQSAGSMIWPDVKSQNWSDTIDDEGGLAMKSLSSERKPKKRRAIYYWRMARQLPWLILRYRL